MTAAVPTPRRRAATAAGVAAALATLMALLTTPFTAAAVVTTAWTITATPPTLVEGQVSDVTLTVTGGTDRIRCLLVSVPADFTVLAASVVSVPAGETWTAHFSGAGPTSVTFSYSSGGGGIQLLQAADFRIQVMPMTATASAWTTTAHSGKSCTSPDVGPPLLPLPPFVIIPGPTPTATATCTPTPTPTVTPTPTPTPTASPTPDPAGGPTPRPTPTGARSPSPRPTPSPIHSPQSSPTATATASASPSGTAPVGTPPPSDAAPAGPVVGSGGGGSSAAQAVLVAGPLEGIRAGSVDIGSTDALGYAWLVPGALLGLPGLLVLLIIGAQAGLAGVFVPLTGRALADREGRSQA